MDKETLGSIASILSATTALVAVLVGPWIAFKLQRRQAVSAMREKWIHELRRTLADLVASAEKLSSIVVQSRSVSEEFRGAHDKLIFLAGEARMMLVESEEAHGNLDREIEKVVALASDEGLQVEDKMKKTRELTQAVVSASRPVFKEAWDSASK